MGTGRTPLLDSLIAGGYVDFFGDFRSGVAGNLVRLAESVSANTRLNRGNLSYIETGPCLYPAVAQATTFNEATIMTSVKVIGGPRSLRAKNATGTRGFYLIFLFGTSARLSWTDNTGTVRNYDTVGTLELKNDYRNVAATWVANNATGCNLYYDGALNVARSTVGHSIITLGERAYEFFAGTGTGCFCQYVIILTKALTDSEVATLYDELDNQLSYETKPLTINKDYPTIGSSVWEARYGMLAGETTMSAGQSIGQLEGLKVSTGTHKATTFLYGSTLAKGVQCVTAGNIIIPDPRPALGTTFGFWYYTAATASWAWVTQASTTIAMGAAGDRVLWATANGQNCLRKY